MSDPVSCSTCGKTEDSEVRLKKCAKCLATLYCSRNCQKADWKEHKKICGQARRCQPSSSPSSSTRAHEGATDPSPPQGLDRSIIKPFHHLNEGTWLHGRSERDVYRLLIDAYRLRVEDDYVFDGEIGEDTIYAGVTDDQLILRGFRRFLRLAVSRQGLIPSWWNASKQAECEALAMDPNQWHCLRFAVEKSDVKERYGHPLFPMQLRMFAESVLLRGIGGQSGAQMKAAMMAAENGNMYVSNIDLSTSTFTNLFPGREG